MSESVTFTCRIYIFFLSIWICIALRFDDTFDVAPRCYQTNKHVSTWQHEHTLVSGTYKREEVYFWHQYCTHDVRDFTFLDTCCKYWPEVCLNKKHGHNKRTCLTLNIFVILLWQDTPRCLFSKSTFSWTCWDILSSMRRLLFQVDSILLNFIPADVSQ